MASQAIKLVGGVSAKYAKSWPGRSTARRSSSRRGESTKQTPGLRVLSAPGKLAVPLQQMEGRLRTREAAVQEFLRHNACRSCAESMELPHNAPEPETDEMSVRRCYNRRPLTGQGAWRWDCRPYPCKDTFSGFAALPGHLVPSEGYPEDHSPNPSFLWWDW
jgi:hypothetical protein